MVVVVVEYEGDDELQRVDDVIHSLLVMHGDDEDVVIMKRCTEKVQSKRWED